MELIKQIKDAEAQSQEIIEQARTQAVKDAQEYQLKRAESLAGSEQERKKAVAIAVSAAEEQALAEVEGLKAQAEKGRQQLRGQVAGRMDGAAQKAVDYLKG